MYQSDPGGLGWPFRTSFHSVMHWYGRTSTLSMTHFEHLLVTVTNFLEKCRTTLAWCATIEINEKERS